MVWTAIGAIGQWACAVATFLAVVVALKPFKRKISVELESVIIKLNEETQILPSAIQIYNEGFTTERIVAIGIISKDGNFILSENQLEIEGRGVKKYVIKHDDFQNTLRLIDGSCFQIWIQVSAGNKYYSKEYPTAKYKETTKALGFFK